jgi:hypothetical protein
MHARLPRASAAQCRQAGSPPSHTRPHSAQHRARCGAMYTRSSKTRWRQQLLLLMLRARQGSQAPPMAACVGHLCVCICLAYSPIPPSQQRRTAVQTTIYAAVACAPRHANSLLAGCRQQQTAPPADSPEFDPLLVVSRSTVWATCPLIQRKNTLVSCCQNCKGVRPQLPSAYIPSNATHGPKYAGIRRPGSRRSRARLLTLKRAHPCGKTP